MTKELKDRQFYCELLDMWMAEHGVEMVMGNGKILEQERNFNRAWIACGHKIPQMKRSLSDIYVWCL